MNIVLPPLPWIVAPVSESVARQFVTIKHYSHRHPYFLRAYGLIIEGKIEGVCVFGQPMPPLLKHAFKDRDFPLYELARLVVQTTAKNAASFLIAGALKQLDPQPCAVVSYADSEQGHCGIVYQATNWIYTGATRSHDKQYVVDGVRLQSITIRDRFGVTNPAEWARKNKIKTIAPMEKHRYFFFCGNKRERKKIASKLQYDIVTPYPKSDQKRYDDGPLLIIRPE